MVERKKNWKKNKKFTKDRSIISISIYSSRDKLILTPVVRDTVHPVRVPNSCNNVRYSPTKQ